MWMTRAQCHRHRAKKMKKKKKKRKIDQREEIGRETEV
jgi:hypothetical protein